ncbi:MAG: ATP-binding cassette domain-containing protein [bacterium]|nr:ATP-binding cassette domain-containing protein [bacterium]
MRIDLVNLSFAYGHRIVIRNMSFSLNNGDFLVIQGKNGSGKSTLIKCLLGMNPVKSGMIFYNHEDIVGFKKWPTIGYVAQRFEDFNYEFPITVNEILSVSQVKRKDSSEKLKLLDRMGILPLLNENINNLSGGQLQRVFIVRAMLNNPELLILDEPTASIDQENVTYFYKAVNELHAAGVNIILISHDDVVETLDFTHILTVDSESDYSFQTKTEYFPHKEGEAK